MCISSSCAHSNMLHPYRLSSELPPDRAYIAGNTIGSANSFCIVGRQHCQLITPQNGKSSQQTAVYAGVCTGVWPRLTATGAAQPTFVLCRSFSALTTGSCPSRPITSCPLPSMLFPLLTVADSVLLAPPSRLASAVATFGMVGMCV